MEPNSPNCPGHDGTPPGVEILLARKKSRLEGMVGLYRRAAEHLKKPEGPYLERLSEIMREVERIREEINTLDEEISRETNSPKNNHGGVVNSEGRSNNVPSRGENSEIKSEIKGLLAQVLKIHEENLSLAKKIYEDTAQGLSALCQGKKATAYLRREITSAAVRLDDIR